MQGQEPDSAVANMKTETYETAEMKHCRAFGESLVRASLIALLFAATVSSVSKVNAENPKSVLTLDLSKYGYAAPESYRYKLALDFLSTSVAFVGDDRLTISFFVQNPHPGLSTRTGRAGGHLLFHSLLVDLSGRLLAQRSWGNADYWNSLLPLSNGNFVVQVTDLLVLYSSSWQKILERKLDYVGDQLPRFAISPSGSKLYRFQDLWDVKKRTWITRNDLLDTGTLEPIASALTVGHTGETVSDQEVVFNSSPETLPPRFSVWSPLQLNQAVSLVPRHSAAEDLIEELKCRTATLLSDSLVALTGNCSAILLIPVAGSGPTLPLQINFSGYVVADNLAVSADGTRFAVILAQSDHKSHRIATMGVAVYDLPERRIVFRANVAPVPQRKIAIGLSKHGDLVAVQNDHRLEIWTVQR